MPQMRGAKDEAVYIYRESFATKQMRHNDLTRRAVFSVKQSSVFQVMF